jgi:DNA replicative helicase MCM subunit Mcm2 (Cdc46/Mcm family)
MVEKKQITPEMRLSEKEIDLIRNAFKDNEKLLKTIRKSMWQMELTEDEKRELTELVKGDEMKKVLRKIFLPELYGDEPILQVIDLWLGLEFKQYTPEEAHNHIKARDSVIKYIDQQLNELLHDMTGEMRLRVELSDNCVADYINLLARNTILMHIEQCLMQLKVLANTVNETPEEMMKRIGQDSSK